MGATYGSVLPDGSMRALHYCLACETVVWADYQPDEIKPDFARAWLELHGLLPFPPPAARDGGGEMRSESYDIPMGGLVS